MALPFFPLELLRYIFQDAFGATRCQFSDPSPTVWGRNDHVPAINALAVCKLWYHVGITILYRILTIRSPAQAVSLAQTLVEFPHLASLVRGIRIEGAFPHLDAIVKACTRADTIFLALWNMLPLDDTAPLCRAISFMNPECIFFVDWSSTYNASHTQLSHFMVVHHHLCINIPTWTRLKTFRYLCFERPESTVYRIFEHQRLHLAEALARSPSLEKVETASPSTWRREFWIISTNPRVTFSYAHASVSESRTRGLQIRDFIREFPHLSGRIQHTVLVDGLVTTLPPPDSTPASPTTIAQPQAPHPAPVIRESCRLTNTDHSPMWRDVFKLALFGSSNMEDIQSSVLSLSCSTRRDRVRALIVARNRLACVSTLWRSILCTALVEIPLIASVEELHALSNACTLNATLGPRIKWLTLDLIPRHTLPTHETSIDNLLPRLTKLQRFVSNPSLQMLPKTFEMLANVAGDTLVVAKHINVKCVAHGCRIPPETAGRLERLEELGMECPPRWDVRKRNGTECFPALSHVVFRTMRTCDAFYRTASYPRLRKVCFWEVTARENAFLKAVGKQIVELEVVLCGLTAETNGRFYLLDHCPALKTLHLGNDELCSGLECFACPKFLSDMATSVSLNTIVINKRISYWNITEFFCKFNPFKFPNLQKIHFMQFSWPTAYYRMKYNMAVEVAVLYEGIGVVVTDYSGQAFRKRLEHRGMQLRQEPGCALHSDMLRLMGMLMMYARAMR